jgi:hypothetical protein
MVYCYYITFDVKILFRQKRVILCILIKTLKSCFLYFLIFDMSSNDIMYFIIFKSVQIYKISIFICFFKIITSSKLVVSSLINFPI